MEDWTRVVLYGTYDGFVHSTDESLQIAIMSMAENGNNEVDINMLANFDMTFFNRLFWVFTKSGNPQIKPYEQFFMEMEEFPLQDIAPILMEMINETMTSKKNQMSQNQPVMKSLQ